MESVLPFRVRIPITQVEYKQYARVHDARMRHAYARVNKLECGIITFFWNLDFLCYLCSMCLSPISLPVRECGRVVRYNVVPCGKCAECVDRKQKDMMQVFLHVAQRTRDIVFATFTYDDDHLPKLWSLHDYEAQDVLFQSFDVAEVERRLDQDYQEIFSCFSLRRRDWRLWLKAARVAWNRKYGYNLDFTYVTIGEYSPGKNRPHYHTMFFGLNLAQAQELCSSWSYGFTFCEPVSKSQPLTGVCRYMAKYLYKGLFESDDVGNAFCEKPRVMASQNLIHLDPKLKSWLIGEDLGYCLDSVYVSPADCQRLLDRRRVLIDDFNYKLGKHFIDKVFKRYEVDEEGKRKLVSVPLQVALSDFIRSSFDSVYDREYRQASEQYGAEAAAEVMYEKLLSDEAVKQGRDERFCSSLQEYYSRSRIR